MKVLVNFRVEPETHEAYKLAAGAAGMSLSDWLRWLADAAVYNSRLGGTALIGNAIALLRDEPEPPSTVVPKGDWSAVEDPGTPAPSGTPTAAASEPPSPPALEAPPALTKPKTAGTPSTVFASERPRAKRMGLCVHRRRVDEFCPRCD